MENPILKKLSAFVFPVRCVFCGRVIPPSRDLCADCAAAAERIDGVGCSFCGLPTDRCACGKRVRFYDAVASAYIYDGVVQQGVLRYKSGKNRRAAAFMADAMAQRYLSACPFPADYVACVPQTAAESEARGFNQNREIASLLAERLSLPLYEGFVKLYDTAPQKSVAFAYKRGNTAGVFDLNLPAQVAGKRLILCDDVKTSGSTIDECAKMLKLYDAAQVFALTFAVVEDKKAQKRQKNEKP